MRDGNGNRNGDNIPPARCSRLLALSDAGASATANANANAIERPDASAERSLMRIYKIVKISRKKLLRDRFRGDTSAQMARSRRSHSHEAEPAARLGVAKVIY